MAHAAAGTLDTGSSPVVAAGAPASPALLPLIIARPGQSLGVGTLPTGIAATNTTAYVANANSGNVSVVNLSAHPATVAATIPVGAYPISVAVSPDASTVYVTNFRSGTLSIINAGADTVTHTVRVGTDPDAVIQVGSRVYVANLLSSSISVVDPGAGTVTSTIPVTGGASPAPSGLAASANGSDLYVNDARNARTDVIALNQATPAVVGDTPVTSFPAYLAVTGSTGYVASSGGKSTGGISVLALSNPTAPAVTKTIAVGSHPYGVAALPAVQDVVAANSADNSLSVIDTGSDSVIQTLPVGSEPDAVTATPDDTTVLVTNENSNTITILHVNQPPVNTVPGPQTVSENAGASDDNAITFSGSNAISTSDPDSNGNPEQVTLSVAHGTLTLSQTSGLTFSSGSNGSGSMTFTGSDSDIDSALNGMTYRPDDGYNGADTLTFSVDDQGNSGDISKPETTTSTVAITVNQGAPTAGNVSYTGAIGNTTFGVGTTPNQPSTHTSGTVLSNSSGPGTLSAVPGTITTTENGTVDMNSDGTFTYFPPAGFTGGNDTFQFQVTNGSGTSTATATITVADMVWYVNDTASSGGTGTSYAPFTSLASVTGPAGPTATGDDIFLFGSSTPYGGGIALKAGQSLIGQSANLIVGGQTVSDATGSNPTITNAGGTGITLGEGDTVSGITANDTSGAGIASSGINAFTLSAGDDITNAGTDGLDITSGDGTIADGVSISGATDHSVAITGRTGGAITLSGPISDTGTGISLTGNTGGTIAFTGTITESTGSSPAFSATGSATGGAATLSVTGSGNTLATTTGTALDVENVPIAASGLTFQSISAGGPAAGPVSAIYLIGTGTTGGLTVTGNGQGGSCGPAGTQNPSPNCSGGTIYNSPDTATGALSTRSAAVELGSSENASSTPAPIGSVSLTDMSIQSATGGGDYGVYASNVSPFTLTDSYIRNEPDEGLQLTGFGGSDGTFDVAGNTLTGQAGTPIQLVYPEGQTTTTGTDSGYIASNVIGDPNVRNSGSTEGDGMFVVEDGTGTLTAAITGNHVNGVEQGYGITAGTNGGHLNVTLTGNNVQQTETYHSPGDSGSLDALNVAEGDGPVCANISGNVGHASNTNFEGLGFDSVGASVGSAYPLAFQLQGYSGPSDDSGGQVEAYLNSTNTLSGANDPTDESIAYNDTNVANGPLDFTGGTCATPGGATASVKTAAASATSTLRTSTRHVKKLTKLTHHKHVKKITYRFDKRASGARARSRLAAARARG